MIEKLKEHDIIDHKTSKVIGKIGCDLREIMDKLNELVDAVNVLQAQVAILEEHAHPTAKTEPSDPYAEQRKWIGNLCKFWDDNYKIIKHYGILTRIDETAIVRYEAENGFWYMACELVKPDDDIIYKGEK